MSGTSPRALMVQDSPSSAAAAAADSEALLASAAAAVGATSATAADDVNTDSMNRCGAVGWVVATAAIGGTGPCVGAGRRRRKTSLALGPAAGTRSAISRWWMRSALIWGAACWKGCGECSWAGVAQCLGSRGQNGKGWSSI
jgi:hypothetical protein